MSYLNNYPGAKTNSGLIPFMINNIPAHKRYFELFCGTAELYIRKEAAEISILADIDSKVIGEHLKKHLPADTRLYNMPFENIVHAYRNTFTRNDFMYLDPPYPGIARRSGRSYYEHEMLSIGEHTEFLELCKTIDANIMISTSPNHLYGRILSDWRVKNFETMGHRGRYTETIYMNYPEPEILHQYNYLGNDFIDRQRIKRKVDRMEAKIKHLPVHERMAILQNIVLHNADHVKHFLSIGYQ